MSQHEVAAISQSKVYEMPKPLRTRLMGLMALGLLAVIIALFLSPQRAWSNLLLNSFYFLCVSLGGLFFIAVHFLAKAGWASALRRIPEALMTALPAAAALIALTLILGQHALYEWSHPEHMESDPLLASKSVYLNSFGVLLRMAIVLGVWLLLAHLMRRSSIRQDGDPSLTHHKWMVRYSAIFVVTFAFTFSVAAFDWLMSLDPHWFSTIFAVYVFAGLFVMGIAAITILAIFLRRTGPLKGIVNENHLHDLGKLLFGFCTFWAYIWLSQYLLIWYANIPEETTFYLLRTGPDWVVLFGLNLILNWVLPFMVLLSRSAKRNERVLLSVCFVVLAGRWLDLFLIIMPETVGAPSIGWIEVLMPIGFAAALLFLFALGLSRASLTPINDPYLKESLQHHQ